MGVYSRNRCVNLRPVVFNGSSRHKGQQNTESLITKIIQSTICHVYVCMQKKRGCVFEIFVLKYQGVLI